MNPNRTSQLKIIGEIPDPFHQTGGIKMKKCTILYINLLALLIIAGTATAQITINQSDLQGLVGKTFNVKTYESTTASDFTALVAQTGTNQTFDFSAITSFSQTYDGTIQYIGLPADLPGSNSAEVQRANIAVKIGLTSTGQASDSTAWIYEQVNSDSLNFAGIVFVSQSDLNGDNITPDTVLISYSPYLLNAKLPLTYQTAWSDSATYNLIFQGSVLYSQKIKIDVTVDGYGTLVTATSSDDCLRLNRTTTMTSNIGGIISSTTTGSIDFITKTGSSIAASIQLDNSGNPISGQYNDLTMGTPIETPPTESLVKDYRLNQNYPNPFNPTTVISYDLRKAGEVKLQVFNSIGQKVATLVNNAQTAGFHKITFNASGLNSGLYFYKLVTSDFTQTKKMMLIK